MKQHSVTLAKKNALGLKISFLITFSKQSSNTFRLTHSFFSVSVQNHWLLAFHTFDRIIMLLRISLENTQSMLIESSFRSGSIAYYAFDQLC